MAVKEKKSETKTTKFEDKDLQTLRDLQKQTDQIVYSLGQITIQRERLNMSEKQLKEELTEMLT